MILLSIVFKNPQKIGLDQKRVSKFHLKRIKERVMSKVL